MWFEMFLKSDFMVVFGVGHLGVRIVSSVVYCCWLLLLKRNCFGSKGCKELEVCIRAKLLGRLVQASKSVSEPLYILQGAHLLCVASLLVWYLFSFLFASTSALTRQEKAGICGGAESYFSMTALNLPFVSAFRSMWVCDPFTYRVHLKLWSSSLRTKLIWGDSRGIHLGTVNRKEAAEFYYELLKMNSVHNYISFSSNKAWG